MTLYYLFCPFCKGAPTLHTLGDGDYIYRVSCCGVTVERDTNTKTHRRWNDIVKAVRRAQRSRKDAANA